MVFSVRILGTPVSAINPPLALRLIDDFIASRKGGYITAPDVYNVTLALQDRHLAKVHEDALMVSPDGTPLVWFGRLRGHKGMRRVCGPDLLGLLGAHGIDRGYRHYFFGGANGVAADLAAKLKARYPGLVVAGAESPPFRPLTVEPDFEACARIEAATPDIVWVGLGAPKQEYWMAANAPHIAGAILIGVGAAFNFHTNEVKRAPVWMRESGLEWFYRLVQEPRRLWRRYFIMAPKFLVLATLELLQIGKQHRDI